jgi:hypothetical protein
MVDNILIIASSSDMYSNNKEERKHPLTTIEEMLMNREGRYLLEPRT